MIAFVRSDDVVVIHSIDRLARNLMDLQSIIKELNDKGASVHFITEQLTFSSDGGSAFQTLGLNTFKYKKIINLTGKGLAILIPLIFASIPITLYVR